MSHESVANRLDGLFYTDRSARRRVILAAASLCALIVFSCVELGVSRVSTASAAMTGVLIGAALMTARYSLRAEAGQSVRSRPARSPRLSVIPQFASVVVLITIFFALDGASNLSRRRADSLRMQANAVENAKTAQALERHLSGITEAVIESRREGRVIPGEVVEQASNTVKQVVIDQPKIVQGWQAASELISYRSQVGRVVPSDLPDCINKAKRAVDQLRVTIASNDPVKTFPVGLVGGYCRLNLDLSAEYEQSEFAEFFSLIDQYRPSNGHQIELQHAVITYSGGPMIPVTRLELFDCIFVFTPPSAPPPPPGQKLTTDLLTADLGLTSVDLAGA